ncbi:MULTISPECIES: hypothetical protein [unclassified Mesorhizobium]|uniref:hypothetical protein n=1 Tax=unclassified Mesorhizobium TaxID=325217 RepID=UPI000401AAD1|nr:MULTISPECIES: hypothetical protein [unclassified Mesorhizobium]WJI82713.1 hypothetical protein NLY34_08200 [Mesorhizobium sp. C374B]WJI89235.1 hypothetical protein NLY42_10605 [Mesorhizobium sp. C372A]
MYWRKGEGKGRRNAGLLLFADAPSGPSHAVKSDIRIKVDGDADTRKSFVDAATTALQKCLPLSFSPTLAQGVAGNVFTVKFASPKQ